MSNRRRIVPITVCALVVSLVVTASAPANERATVTLNALFDTQATPGLQAVVANFQKAYPNITINATYQLVTQECTTLVTEAAAGNAPDIFTLNLGNTLTCATYPMAAAGQLLPLGGTWLKRVPAVVQPLLQRKHRAYAYPSAMTAFVFAYNKNIFSQLGIQPLTQTSTFSDVLAICNKVSAAGQTPIALSGVAGASGLANLVFDLAYQETPSDWTHQRFAGKTTFASAPQWQNAFAMVQEMQAAHCFQSNVAGTSVLGAVTLFAAGQAAMVPLFDSQVVSQVLPIGPNFSVGISPIPAQEAAHTKVYVSAYECLAINSKTANAAAAQQFIAFVARPAESALVSKVGGGVTTFDFEKGNYPGSYSNFGTMFKTGQTVYAQSPFWKNPSVANALRNSVAGIFTGQLTSLQILQSMDQAWG